MTLVILCSSTCFTQILLSEFYVLLYRVYIKEYRNLNVLNHTLTNYDKNKTHIKLE